jgi:hypothetical protein
MKVTNIAPCHDQVSVDSGRRAARYSFLANADSSKRAVSLDASRENEDAVHLNGQDPDIWTPSVEARELCIDSVALFNSPLLDRESSSPQVTQNDVVVLAGERGTWQVVAPVNGSKADIRRREGFDTRVVTAGLENLTVVRCAGSPGCNY